MLWGEERGGEGLACLPTITSSSKQHTGQPPHLSPSALECLRSAQDMSEVAEQHRGGPGCVQLCPLEPWQCGTPLTVEGTQVVVPQVHQVLQRRVELLQDAL